MGKVTLVLKDDLEERFREAIYKSKGMKRGNIQMAIEEAIEMWIKEMSKKESIRKRQI
jgi:hypothetical protein